MSWGLRRESVKEMHLLKELNYMYIIHFYTDRVRVVQPAVHAAPRGHGLPRRVRHDGYRGRLSRGGSEVCWQKLNYICIYVYRE